MLTATSALALYYIYGLPLIDNSLDLLTYLINHIDLISMPVLTRMSASSRNHRDSVRTVPMQVLSLGMSRTGTVSMQAALELLGCKPTYHGFTPLYNLDHLPAWTAAFEAKYHHNGEPFTRQDWDRLLGGYGAVTDSPCICFAEDLINAYPDAKVVLVERDVDAWYQSFQELIDVFYHPIHRILRYLDPKLIGPTARMFAYVFRDKQSFYRAGSKKELQQNAKTIYKEHYELVRRVCPKERLLEFDLKDGWGPLCGFLGKEEPEVSFPRLNERGSLEESSKRFQKAGLLNVLRNSGLGVISAGVALFAVGWTWRRWS